MKNMDAKLKNFWFYYKKHILVGLAVLAVLAYLGIQKALTPKPDYHIGLIQTVPCTEESLLQLEARFTEAGEDRNGDGEVLVQIHTYFVDLKEGVDSSAMADANPVAALDADLIGNVSGIFLLEDAVTFQEITGGILEPVIPEFGQGLFLGLRKDAPEAYKTLAGNLF